MSDEILNFEEHSRRRRENAGTVRCAKCGEWIVATATRCPECGIHFQGEAQYFSHPSEQGLRKSTPMWVIVLAVGLVLAMIAGLMTK